MSLLRPGVIVRNRTRYPDAEVRAIVERHMHGDRRRPPTVIVLPRNLPSDTREGFTPFDRQAPIEIWLEPAYRYPEPGARGWRQELALSAAHEDWHFAHPGDACPEGRCERQAEAYARHRYRALQPRR